jgi:F0F1-type ATP synthase membrane subunit c/vacuolar-type H+-ATPase subunit K
MYFSLFKTLCMTEKQTDKLFYLIFTFFSMVSIISFFNLLLNFIFYLIKK